MKEVREERFTKKEDVGFNPVPITKTPTPPDAGDTRGAVRTNERTIATPMPHERPTGYVVAIPSTRRKTRQSFDIFEDQYDALKKLQLAEADQAGHQHGRKMGDMVQEALDAFISDRARRLGTISIKRLYE